MKNLNLALAISVAISIQAPLGYLFVSLESLVLGHGFIGAPNGIYMYLVMAIIVSTAIVIVIGLPTYTVMKIYKLNTTINVALAGIAIPVIIMLFIILLTSPSPGFSSGENYYGTYREIIVHGNRTFWGWVKLVESIVTFGIHGLIGAILFHTVYQRGSDA